MQTPTTCNLIKIKDIPAKYPQGGGGGYEEDPGRNIATANAATHHKITSETPPKDAKRTLSSTQFVQIRLHLAPMRFTIEK